MHKNENECRLTERIPVQTQVKQTLTQSSPLSAEGPETSIESNDA